jgi:hypothetical protein
VRESPTFFSLSHLPLSHATDEQKLICQDRLGTNTHTGRLSTDSDVRRRVRDESSADAAAAGSAAAAAGGGGLIATAKKAKNQLTNPVRNTHFCHAMFVRLKMHHFTKTGSGQTRGSTQKRCAFGRRSHTMRLSES